MKRVKTSFWSVKCMIKTARNLIYNSVCAWSLSRVWLFMTPWSVAHWAPLSLGILQASILEWVAMPSSRKIFSAQGSNPGVSHCWQVLYPLSHKGSPKLLEWVAYPFSREASQARNQTGVSCTAGGFFTSWATPEAHIRY